MSNQIDDKDLFDPSLDPVLFYGEYHPLSLFYAASIEIGGEIFDTPAHYYYASKFNVAEEPGIRVAIIYASTPDEAKEISRVYNNFVRAEWNECMKLEVYFRATLEKFQQNPNMAEILLKTGMQELVENCPSDVFWGRSENIPEGSNNSGRTLMRVRKILQEAATARL